MTQEFDDFMNGVNPNYTYKSKTIRIEYEKNEPKHIYIVILIEDEGERVLFATHNLKYAESYCKKANKMIKKWTKYWDKRFCQLTTEKSPYNERFRLWQWNEVRKVVIVKTELR